MFNSLWPHGLSPPDSSVHGILQARILEWVAIPFSRGSSQPRDWTRVSCFAGGSFTIWATMEAQSTSQSQTCKTSPKRLRSLFGGLLPIWSTTAFWILVKPLHLRSMLSKSMRCVENSNACSRHNQQKGPSSSQQCPAQLILQKLKELGYEVLSHLPHSPDLSPNNYHFFQNVDNVLQAKCFHSQQEAESAFQEFIESQSIIFML